MDVYENSDKFIAVFSVVHSLPQERLLMTNKHKKLSDILLYWTFNNFNESEDGLTSSPQQEAVTLFLGYVQIFAVNQRNFNNNSEL